MVYSIQKEESDPDSSEQIFYGVSRAVPVFAQVASQLIGAIEGGQFPVGSRLPGEQELARRFDVSRPSIREALSCLQFEGYIEPRRGSGTEVVSAVGRVTLQLPSIRENYSLLDTLEARLAIEPLVVRLAALDPDPKALKRLTRILEGMQLAISEPTVHARTDLVVHTALVRVCRNKLLSGISEGLLNQVDDSNYGAARVKAWHDPTLLKQWLEHHETIADAVTKGDTELAESACRAHLVSVVINIVQTANLIEAERLRADTLVRDNT